VRGDKFVLTYFSEILDGEVRFEKSTATRDRVETSPTLERKRAKYTVEDVRQLCGGISRSTVMREIRRKRLACYRARRTLRFSEEHITKYLERVEQGAK